MADDKALDKIKKLLRQSKGHGATDAEMETALAAAQRLALKHSVNLDEIDTAEAYNTAGEPIESAEFTPTRTGGGECAARFPTTHKYLVWLLERFFKVKVIECTNWKTYVDKGIPKGGRVKHMEIIGRKTNVQVAIYVYNYLHREFTMLWHDHRLKSYAQMKDRNSFFFGLYSGLVEKLQVTQGEAEMELQDAIPSNQSLAMVLVGESEKIDATVKEKHPRLTYISRDEGKINDYNAVYEGQKKGREIEIKTALK